MTAPTNSLQQQTPRTTVTRLHTAPRRPQTGPDDAVPVAAVQGALALDLRGCTGEPATPELRLVPAGATAQAAGRRTPDEVRVWSARFAQAVVEVLGGDRPLSQLLRWTSLQVYEDLSRRVRILGRTSAAPQRLRTVRPQVRSVHVCQPAPGAAEVSVHVRHGLRSRAIAARLEVVDGRWQCTVLQLG